MGREQTKIFGDVLIPGTEYIVMERVLAASRVLPEDEVAYLWQISEALSRVVQINGRRVWWKFRRKKAGYSYISLDPGEYSEKEPPYPADVREMPNVPPAVTCKEILEAARSLCRLFPPLTDRERSLLRSADRLLTANPEAPDEVFLRRFKVAGEVGRTNPGQEFAKAINELYTECLFGFEMPVSAFSEAIILLQIQRALNGWIEQPWYQNPGAFRAAYVEHVSSDPAKRSQFCSLAIEGGNFEYDAAAKGLQQAFVAGMMSGMGSALMLAHHRYRTALWFHATATKLGAKASDFEYSQISAEEGMVCTLTGISMGALLFARPQSEHARKLLQECGPDLSALRRSARKWATHIQPIWTRHFCDIIAAEALIGANTSDSLREGIAALEKQRNEIGSNASDCEFEKGWLDQSLLTAYRAADRSDDALKKAAGIAGRLLMRTALQ